jgi:hypothetical protein
MIEDKDHYILLKTIKGIKDNVDKMYTLGNDELQFMRDEFLNYLRQLVDVVFHLTQSMIKKNKSLLFHDHPVSTL